MSGRERLQIYLDGWRTGESAQSLAAMAEGFHYDDPDTGRIRRDGFVEFFEAFKEGVAEMRGGTIGTPFLEYTDMVVCEDQSLCWCWWRATGTDFQGSAVIRFGDNGVVSERIAYFTPLP